MTTAAELVSAASAADWSSFKSLVLAATPGDIEAIGSDWNNVMDAIGDGVSGSAQAPKSLFNSTMTAFFAAAGPYLTGDSVVGALDSIAQNSWYTSTDHLSVEMIAIMNAVPAAVAATAPSATLNDTLVYIQGNQLNPEVTPAELNNTFGALVEKFGAGLDIASILTVVSSLAQNDPYLGTDSLASVRTLLAAEPANASGVSPLDLGAALSGIITEQLNPAVSPQELNNTLKTLVSHYGAAMDANSILEAVAQLSGNDTGSGSGTDYLASVRTLLSAVPANLAEVNPSDMQNALFAISMEQYNPAVTPEELNNTFKAFVSTYGTVTDVNTLLNLASGIANSDINSYTDNLAAVRTLLSAEPANAAEVDPSSPGSVMYGIISEQFNPAVTQAEINNTLKVLVSHYGAAMDVNTILDGVSLVVSNDPYTGTDSLALARTLLAAEPSNTAELNPYSLENALWNIVTEQFNPAVTPEEINSTLKMLLSGYGAVTDVNLILNLVSQIAGNDLNDATDNLASVRTLLGVEPANAADVNPYTLQDALRNIAGEQFNFAVTPQEINSTLKALVSHYGAELDVNSILDVVSQIAQSDLNAFTDNFASLRTLLGADPANAAEANPVELQNALYSIIYNFNNLSVTPEELNSTLKAFVSHYGTATDVNAILDAASGIAFNDLNSGADNFASIHTLLGAHPANISEVDPFTLQDTLYDINANNQNPGVSEHELAQTLARFMATYGALADAADLADAITADTDIGTYEAAGAIANHLDATHFADVATAVNASGTTALLTTGNDSFDGTGSGALAVYGGAGRDTIDFSASAETTGRYLDGGAGADTLTGGLGDDVLNGGAGADTLTGGAGADTFRFDHAGAAADHVTDFNAAEGDRIDLHDLLDASTGLAISDYVSLQEVAGNTILSVDIDGAGTAHGFVQIAQLDNTTGLDVNTLYAQGQIIV